MTVRAKFVVQSITRQKGWGGHAEVQTIKLSPVSNGSEEDKKFFAATPSGSVELGVVNPDAGNYFELNQAYYLDFTKAAA
jgi:hypothetical protein